MNGLLTTTAGKTVLFLGAVGVAAYASYKITAKRVEREARKRCRKQVESECNYALSEMPLVANVIDVPNFCAKQTEEICKE